MLPCFKVVVSSNVEHDYAALLGAEDGLQIERNDLDAEGAGRSLLDGLMYRSRITQKLKIVLKFLPLTDTQMKQVSQDLKPEFITIKIVDPDTDQIATKTVYTSQIMYGCVRYNRGLACKTYEGCTVSLIER